MMGAGNERCGCCVCGAVMSDDWEGCGCCQLYFPCGRFTLFQSITDKSLIGDADGSGTRCCRWEPLFARPEKQNDAHRS